MSLYLLKKYFILKMLLPSIGWHYSTKELCLLDSAKTNKLCHSPFFLWSFISNQVIATCIWFITYILCKQLGPVFVTIAKFHEERCFGIAVNLNLMMWHWNNERLKNQQQTHHLILPHISERSYTDVSVHSVTSGTASLAVFE